MNSALFVDGTNVYASQYQMFGPHKVLDFPSFVKEVEKSYQAKFSKIYFYCSYSPVPKKANKKQKLYLKNEHFFYKYVRSTPKLFFFKGYRSKTSGKEKVVDVKLASDVVAYSITKKFKKIYVLTGDADFLEALRNAKRFSPKVKINILSLENKVMYRGSHYFPLSVITFGDKTNKLKNKSIRYIRMSLDKLEIQLK